MAFIYSFAWGKTLVFFGDLKILNFEVNRVKERFRNCGHVGDMINYKDNLHLPLPFYFHLFEKTYSNQNPNLN